MASQQAPPSIPPRPSRSKSPQAQSTPLIPPRPARPARSKSPSENLTTNAQSPIEEPQPTIIPSSTELHAPIAISGRPAPVPRVDSDAGTARSTAASTPSLYRASTDDIKDVEKEGIPQIGRRVPMHPNAGDVQAPTPSETPSSNRKKHVYREEWEMDEGAYGAQRNKTPYSMSSTDLNAVVAHTNNSGVGTRKEEPGVPDEELGYLASDQYIQAVSRAPTRAASPTTSTREGSRHDSGGSNDGKGSEEDRPTDDDGNLIHVDAPTHGGGYLRRGNSDYESSRAASRLDGHKTEGIDEEEEERETYSVLAGDEVLKRKQGKYMQAAISPPGSNRPKSTPRNEDEKQEKEDLPVLALSTKGTDSRYRTPYEELSPADENAKPLFSDDEDGDEEDDKEEKSRNPDDPLPARPKSKNKSVDHLRPALKSEHRFPSKDVWEEAPEYSQLQAEVQSPPPGRIYPAGDDHNPEDKERQGDRPKTEQDYRVDLKDLSEDSRLKRLQNPKGSEGSESSSDKGPTRRKFPSNDIWEDQPPSLELEASLGDDEKDRATTGDARATSESAGPTTSTPVEGPFKKPEIPARPSIPARPQRGAKLPPTGQSAAPKQRPAVPPRKPGGKIAALKGALGDLDSKLKMGMFPPKREEKPVEVAQEEFTEVKEPLIDPRKSRAKGPRGRKPPTKEDKPIAEKVEKRVDFAAECEIVGAWTVFTLDEDLDAVVVDLPTEESEKAALEQKFIMSEPETKEESPLTTTATLPGVQGTGDTKPTEIQTKPSETITEDKPAAEQGNPTVIPTSGHPEDAIEQRFEDLEGPKTVDPSRTGTLVEKRQSQDIEHPDQADEASPIERLANEV
ncbi:hypothetical protein EDC01DRAFT_617479 [Geopyxis carbonaria]|nr:hypothetical protein EDC01DRAFT_617479 [Geopyxis carbonaria]